MAMAQYSTGRERRIQQESENRKGAAQGPPAGIGTDVFKSMDRFLLWDHDGVLVDTEPLYFAATQECVKLLGIELDQSTYWRLMTAGRTSWELAREQGIAEAKITEAREERDRRYQQYL